MAPAPTFGLPPRPQRRRRARVPDGALVGIGILIGTLLSGVLFTLAYVLFLTR